MVRAKQNPTPTTERKVVKSKPNKAVVNTRSSNRVLSKTKSPNVVNVPDGSSSEGTKSISGAEESIINDNDKPSSKSVKAKKTVKSTKSTSASISKMSDVLINKQGVSKVPISKAATVSTSNNTSVAQKIALPRVLPTAALVPKYVFIKIDRPPRIFEQLRTVRTSTGCYVSVPNAISTSTPIASQKVAPNVQQKDQSKSPPSNVSKHLAESRNILHALLQKDKNAESSAQQKEQKQPNASEKDQSPNAVQNDDKDVSTAENDQSSNTKQSNLEKIQSEILNTKFLPIQPKPPGYQVLLLLFLLILSMYIVKVKIIVTVRA